MADSHWTSHVVEMLLSLTPPSSPTHVGVQASALDRGMALLSPRSPLNQGSYGEVATLVNALKAQLLGRPSPYITPMTQG